MTEAEREYYPAGAEWTTDSRIIDGKGCRYWVGGRGCGRPAAAALNRGRRGRTLWWCYCDDPVHLFGRKVENGVVMDWRVKR